MKKFIAAILGVALFGQAVPIIDQEMRWLHSYETVQFTNGDLGLDEYAVVDNGWYIRLKPATEAGIEYTESRSDIKGKTEVQIVCEKCAYYSVFENNKGERVRVLENQQKYKRLGTVKNEPLPSKTEKVTLSEAREASAAIAFDGVSDDNIESSASSISWSHTVTSNTLGAIFVGVHAFDATDADRPATAVSFNGDALALARRSNDNTANVTTEIWYLAPPDQVTGTVQIDYTGSVSDTMGGAVSYTGVAQADPLGAIGGTSPSNTDTPSATIVTTAVNSVVFANITGTQATAAEVTADAPQSQQWGLLSSRNYGGADQPAASITTYTSAWTQAGGTGVADWAIALAEILADTGGGGGGADPAVGEEIMWFNED
jgi:hypothetical protein